VFLTRGMLSNNAAATAGKGENLLHLGRASKKGPFPNFPQRGTPLISGLLVWEVACCSGEPGWAPDTAKTEVDGRTGTWPAAGAQLMSTSVGRADL
jgi:hypothetical protein